MKCTARYPRHSTVAGQKQPIIVGNSVVRWRVCRSRHLAYISIESSHRYEGLTVSSQARHLTSKIPKRNRLPIHRIHRVPSRYVLKLRHIFRHRIIEMGITILNQQEENSEYLRDTADSIDTVPVDLGLSLRTQVGRRVVVLKERSGGGEDLD